VHPCNSSSPGPSRGWARTFTIVSLRHRFPLLDVRLFARPDFATGAVGVTFLFLANFGFFFVVMQYLDGVMAYSPPRTALALAPLFLPVVILSVSSSWYLPRLGLRATVSIGLLFIAAGLVGMRTLEIGSSFPDLVRPLLVLSTGSGFCTAPTTSAIMGAVPDEKQGVASAVDDATREIGAALGIAVAGPWLAVGRHRA
jgi:predicted MFS family arabinose efflux permease